MKFTSKLMLAAVLFSGGLFAQTPLNNDIGRGCGTLPPGEQWDNWFNAKVKEYQQDKALGKTSVTTYVIPVIVHVIHGGQAVGTNPNISQAQVNSQITVLNNDYAGTGFGVSSLPSVFSGLVANTNISFCLAKFDPDGNCLTEPGIDRVDYHTITSTNPNSPNSSAAFISYMDGTIKPATIWDPVRYLNIWVTDVSNAAQLLGYATFPGGTSLSGLAGFGTASTDGVWVWSKSFGTGGVTLLPYNKGRTATHEIGHWVGLRHTWGDGTCATDYCNDTPPSQTSNFGCPSHPYKVGVCSGNTTGEMFQNFMDYSDDACLALFTTDQNTRIQVAMTNGTYRKQLTASSGTLCNAAAAAPNALFSVSSNSICVDSLVDVTNLSDGSPCPNYSWSVTPSTGYLFVPASSSLTTNPGLKFTSPGFYTLTLVATNSIGTSVKTDIIDVYDCNDVDGIAENKLFASKIMLVPNPSNGMVSILTRFQNNQNLNVSMYNAQGQLVFKQYYNEVGSSNLALNLTGFANGIYYVSLDNGNQKVAKRLVLNK